MHRLLGLAAGASLMFGVAGCASSPEAAPSLLSPSVPVETTVDLPPLTISFGEPAPETTSVRAATSTSTNPETATTLVEGVNNPKCVVRITAGMSLGRIAKTYSTPGHKLTTAILQKENGITNPDLIKTDELIDICPDGVNDIDGSKREPATTAPAVTVEVAPVTLATAAPDTAPATTKPPVPVAPAPTAPSDSGRLPSGIKAEQTRLNQLLVPLGMMALTVDGIAGDRTKQGLCTARWLMGLPETFAVMQPGSDEEKILMTAGLSVPDGTPANAARWGYINQTCQSAIYGEKGTIVFVFPDSTGKALTATDNGTYKAFRYDPAVANAGWHNSSEFPVDTNSTLLGNMYKPIYFKDGKAVHGALNVPPLPASHGCVRNVVTNQDKLVTWLGYDGITAETFNAKILNFTIVIKGAWAGALAA